MPLLEFKCKRQHVTERLFSPFVEEGPLPLFIQCGTKGCRLLADRIISASGPVLFKGAGWTPKGGA